MVEVVGISTQWENHMRKVKRGVIRALRTDVHFTGVYVSRDLADKIQHDTGLIGEVGDDTTFEAIPLKVDNDLPLMTVIYIWETE